MAKINYLAAAAAKPAKSSKKKHVVRQEVEGLEHYSAFVAVGKGVGALQTADGAPVKAELEAQFIEEGCDLRQTPENFHAIEGKATASVQLRRKTIKSPLTALEVRALRAHKIPVKHVKATFQVAEKYMDRADILEKLNEALNAFDLPEDLFEQNTEDRHVVTDETVDAIFKKGDVAVAQKLIPLVAAVTISSQWNGTFMDALRATINDLKAYEPAADEEEVKVERKAGQPKVQHLPAASNRHGEPQKIAPVVAKVEKAAKAATAKARPAKAVESFNRSSAFTKGEKLMALWHGTGPYECEVVAVGIDTIKVKWADDGSTMIIPNTDVASRVKAKATKQKKAA